ncbi:MAG: hypothetical protein PHV25_01450 [Candidatus Pacebacteria bacterium]|nr:hypothetical protein [Candidatus Paceibacterota bacterium]
MKNIIVKIYNIIIQLIIKNYFDLIAAKQHRSFDVMSAVLLWMLSYAENNFKDFTIKNKNVLEIGSGKFFVHPTVFKLLGAKKVISIDKYMQLSSKAMKVSFENSIISKKLLSRHIQHDEYLEFMKKIEETKYQFNRLEELGIQYIAPVNTIQFCRDNKEKFDIVFSYTVLEHVLEKEIIDLVDASLFAVSKGGFVLHFIDLEDHQDPKNKPINFLTKNEWSGLLSNKRGNRLRFSDWSKVFLKYNNFDFIFPYRVTRNDFEIPSGIINKFLKYSEEDLRITGFVVVGRRKY